MNPLSMVDLILMADPVPIMGCPMPMVDPIPMVGPMPMVDPCLSLVDPIPCTQCDPYYFVRSRTHIYPNYPIPTRHWTIAFAAGL